MGWLSDAWDTLTDTASDVVDWVSDAAEDAAEWVSNAAVTKSFSLRA